MHWCQRCSAESSSFLPSTAVINNWPVTRPCRRGRSLLFSWQQRDTWQSNSGREGFGSQSGETVLGGREAVVAGVRGTAGHISSPVRKQARRRCCSFSFIQGRAQLMRQCCVFSYRVQLPCPVWPRTWPTIHLKVWLLGRSSSCQVDMKVQCHHDRGSSLPGRWLPVPVPSVVSQIRLRVSGTLVLQWGRMRIASKQCSPWRMRLISAPWYIGFVFQTNEFKSCNCYFHYILLQAVVPILYSMD